jgi:flagellin
MTRINTNVSSLIAQNTLARNSADLQQALTRLSTGLRINVGKDDPAGLIASEALRSDITSIDKAITNSERANQVIATADSALGQVSSLLNDIRGLVVEAANTGALSPDQLAANQLQVDSSLEAINRIAQTTTFQGRRLLDGSLDFTSTISQVASVRDAQIDQANLGATGSVTVDIVIAQAATRAQITNETGFSAAAQATATLSFNASADVALTNATINIKATAAGVAESGVDIDLVDAVGATTASYAAGVLTITADITNTAITAQDLVDAVNTNVPEFTASADTPAGAIVAGDAGAALATTGIDSIQLQAVNPGAEYNNVSIVLVAGASSTAAYNASQKTITVTVNQTGAQLASDIATAINGSSVGSLFVATGTDAGAGIDITGVDADVTGSTANTGGNVLNDDLVFSIGGATGREVFNFEQGASANQISAAINLVSDATGVSAEVGATGLILNSTQYGSAGIIDVEIISEGSSGTFKAGLSTARATGTNIEASVNGVNADGAGNTLAINTATLDLQITVTDGSNTNFQFVINGGGALFQLGPDVVSNQQARMGIQSLNTAALGGINGRLHELASGGTKALATDPSGAYKVVDEVISKVTRLRGRLGAFQRTTLETNIASLNDTVVNLTQAESSIRDADFAKESSALTRAQILVQSGTSVLAIANSNPQSVLALLR